MYGVWRSPVSAPALGAGGHGFESRYPDHRCTSLVYIHLDV